MYDLILYNNTTKDSVLYSGLTDKSENNLYYDFSGLDLDLPLGEYTYFVLFNEREDVQYMFKDVPLNSILHTEDGDVLLRDLEPETGLLRITGCGCETNPLTKDTFYVDKNVSYQYYKRKG